MIEISRQRERWEARAWRKGRGPGKGFAADTTLFSTNGRDWFFVESPAEVSALLVNVCTRTVTWMTLQSVECHCVETPKGLRIA